mmetsp:Transcript_57652/g.135681  ORF Transcript_57652/g.135681 Transcript_57652/m.135681 type:complete len:823 (+) Transcript_57652:883-3351(+)
MHAQLRREAGQRHEAVLGLQVHQHQALAALGLVLELIEREAQQPPLGAQHTQLQRHRIPRHPRQQRRLALVQRQEGLAGLLTADQVADLGDEAIAGRARHHEALGRRAGEVVRDLAAGLQLDHGGDRLAVTAAARQRGHRHGVDPAVAADDDQRVDAAAAEVAPQRVAGLEGLRGNVHLVAFQCPHPALLADDDGDRLVDDLHFGNDPLVGLDQGAAVVAVLLGVGFDLLDDGAAQRGGRAEDVFELGTLVTQLGQLLLDLDRLQPGQLAQPDFEDVLGLAVAQVEARDQGLLGLVRLADDADDLVDVQQHQLPALEHMDALVDLGQAMLGAAAHRGLTEAHPLAQHLAQALLRGAAVGADHGQVDRRAALQAGVGQQRVDQVLLLHRAALGLEDDAHRRVLAGLVAHAVQHRQQAGLELQLLGRQRLFAGLDLGVGELLDLLQHLLRAGAVRQLGDDQLPLATGQVLDLPARPQLEAAAARHIGRANLLRRADELAAAGEVRAGQQLEQRVIGQVLIFQQGHRRRRHLAQVVAGDLGGQADGDAAGAVEQREGQARRQLDGFLGRAVVIGPEVHRALVDLVQHEAGDRGQSRFGVAHRRGAVAVAAAEIAVAVDQRVAQREVLRHAHQRVVDRLVAMRVEAAEHIAHHLGTLDRLGTRVAAPAQAQAVHGVEDAALHRLLPVGIAGQRATLDDAERVLEVGLLGVGRQGQRVGIAATVGGAVEIDRGLGTHGCKVKRCARAGWLCCSRAQYSSSTRCTWAWVSSMSGTRLPARRTAPSPAFQAASAASMRPKRRIRSASMRAPVWMLMRGSISRAASARDA